MTARMGRQSLAMASVVMAGAAYVSYASGLLGSVLTARTLGPKDFGVYSYVVWLTGVLVALMNNGLPVSAIKFTSEAVGGGQMGLAAALHGRLRSLQFLSMSMVGVVALVILCWSPPAGWSGQVLALALVVVVAALAKSTYLFNTSLAKGFGEFSIEAKSVLVLSLANLVALTLAWIIGVSLWAMLGIYIAISLGYAGVVTWLMRQRQLVHVSSELPQVWRDRLRRHLGWTFVLTAVAVFNEGSVNVYLLNEHVGSAEVGFYAIASGLTKAGMDLLTVGLSSVLMSAMGHAVGKDGQLGLGRVFGNAVRHFHFFGLLLMGLGLLCGDAAVQVLYGARYEMAVPIMKLMFVLGGITLSEGVFASLLSVMDRQRERVLISALCTLVTAPLSWWLITSKGLDGAIVAYGINRLLVFSVVVISAIHLSRLFAPWAALLKLSAASGAAMILPLLVQQTWGAIWVAACSALVFLLSYVAVCARIGIWLPGELDVVFRLLRPVPFLSQFARLLLAQPLEKRGA
jgi:O-antigen/teichoic acid export membrane protein